MSPLGPGMTQLLTRIREVCQFQADLSDLLVSAIFEKCTRFLFR